MINKKLLSGILCIVFLLSTLSVSALTFSDVENDPAVAWAKPYINAMADAGYLKGYEDGTFKPNNTISKTEALILLARMIGVNDASYADSVEYAVEEYASVLDNYSTNYTNEISFLLYSGVLDESDLNTYISNTNKNMPLKRYEAAILLTKLLGAEEEVLDISFVPSSYADTVEIPDSARAYVEYVKEQGIMQGMGNNADGEPEFWPNTAVTRSQMAKMLHSLIDVIDLSAQTGTIVSFDEDFSESITITIDGNDIVTPVTESTKYKINGTDVSYEDMSEGMYVKVTHVAGKVTMIENNVVVEDTVVYGLVSNTKDTGTTKSITIADANDTKIVETYILAEKATIKVSGAIDLFSKVKKNNYVSLTIEDGVVTLLEVIDKSTSASGTLASVNVSGEYTILNIEDTSGNVAAYEVSADGVAVTRNSRESSLSELMQGDTIVVKMTYGKVTKISASSKNQTLSGTIESILHTTDGTVIGIKSGSKVAEYKVNKSVDIIIDSSEPGTVYDLRPGSDVNVGIESSEIVSIEAAGSVEKSQIIGTVVTTNTSHNLMVVKEGSTEYNVFCTSNTTIFDSQSGKSTSLKNVEKGRTASVTGSNASGVFEATVIVLQ